MSTINFRSGVGGRSSSSGGGSSTFSSKAPVAAPGVGRRSSSSGGGSSTLSSKAPVAAPGVGGRSSTMNFGGAAEPISKKRGIKDIARGGLKTLDEHLAKLNLRPKAATAALNWNKGRSAPSDSDYSNPGDYR